MNSDGSFWRPVDVRVWEADDKFPSLSRAEPNAQTLFLFLLTGPHTTSLPGLSVCGIGTIAEVLRWPFGGVDACMAELVAAGMIKFDRARRVVYLPNALRYNAPDNPNVVRGYARHFSMIPPSPLKMEFWSRLKAHCAKRGDGFAAAFDAVIEEPDAPTPDAPDLFDPAPGTVSGTVKRTVRGTVRQTGKNQERKEPEEELLSGETPDRHTIVSDATSKTGGPAGAEPAIVAEKSFPGVSGGAEAGGADAIPYVAIIGHLNDATGKTYHHTGARAKGNRTLVAARWKEGFRLQDFIAAIDGRVAAWRSDPKMVDFLRPKTLFCASNFEGYVAAGKATNGGASAAYSVEEFRMMANSLDFELSDGGLAAAEGYIAKQPAHYQKKLRDRLRSMEGAS